MAGAQETRDGVGLTNLDQPLFDGDEATKRDLVDYLDAVRDRILPGAARPAAVGDPGAARAGAVHAEEPAEVHPGLGTPHRDLGRGLPPRGVVRALRRPAHPALVRQPAGGRVPPDAGHRDPTRTSPPTWCSTSTRPRATPSRAVTGSPRLVRRALADVGLAGAVKTSGAKGAARLRAGARRTPPPRTWPPPPGRSRRAPQRLDPALATTAFIREDRGGKVFLDPTRAGGATVVAAYSPRLRPGLPVSFPVAWDEPRRGHPGRLHRAHRRPRCSATGTRGPSDARTAAAPGRPGRRGAHHPGRPGAGDARGETPRQGPPRSPLTPLTPWPPAPLRPSWPPPCRPLTPWPSSFGPPALPRPARRHCPTMIHSRGSK